MWQLYIIYTHLEPEMKQTMSECQTIGLKLLSGCYYWCDRCLTLNIQYVLAIPSIKEPHSLDQNGEGNIDDSWNGNPYHLKANN